MDTDLDLDVLGPVRWPVSRAGLLSGAAVVLPQVGVGRMSFKNMADASLRTVLN